MSKLESFLLKESCPPPSIKQILSILSHNLTHKLNRILELKLNSAKRSPELSKTLFTKA
ncbi:hypothetical protein LEP1GSC072_0635, partial [Leptospira noguchii str. Bonito]